MLLFFQASVSLKIKGKAHLQIFCVFLAISYLGFKRKQSAILRSCIQQTVLILLSPGYTQQRGKRIFSWSMYFHTAFKTSSSKSVTLIRKEKNYSGLKTKLNPQSE